MAKEKIVAVSTKEHLKLRINLTFGRETGDEDHPFSSQKTIAALEVFSNSIDAIQRQKIKDGRIRIEFLPDNVMIVTDNGGGIPVSKGETADGKPASSLYLALGVLQSGSNFYEIEDRDYYTTGTNGVGAASLNVLTRRLDAEVYRDGKIYELQFNYGEPGFYDDKGNFKESKDLTYLRTRKDDRPKAEKEKFPSGTKITSYTDETEFKTDYPIDHQEIISRARGAAALIPGLEVEVINHIDTMEDGSPQHFVYKFEDGLADLVRLQEEKEPISDVSVIRTQAEYTFISGNKEHKRTIPIEVAFSWENGFDYHLESYVNTISTRLHGIHVNAFERAMQKTFNERFRSIRGLLYAKDEDPKFDDFKEGLNAVVSVYLHTPEFTSQIKEELGGRREQKAIQDALEDAFRVWLNTQSNYNTVKAIGEKVVQAMRVRVSSREKQELERQKRQIERSTKMPAKLLDCELIGDPLSQLFICEGNSAASSLLASRDSVTQALLPIRGKILNVLKASKTQTLANQEINDIAKALDCGVGKNCNVDNARYQNVICAADADSDGQNINALLVTLFWELFPDYIRKGRLFVMNPPLFIIRVGSDERHYAMTEEERDEIVASLPKGKSYRITRCKGLGEMTAEDMWNTSMNPETRTLTQVVIDDFEEDKETLDTAMGKNVKKRRAWLVENPIEIYEG